MSLKTMPLISSYRSGGTKAECRITPVLQAKDGESASMMLTTADLVKTDQEHMIHPLHDHSEPVIYVRGCNSTIWDVEGRQYLDGLSCLWNVNVGHGREELAQAASEQMKELAF